MRASSITDARIRIGPPLGTYNIVNLENFCKSFANLFQSVQNPFIPAIVETKEERDYDLHIQW